MKTSVENYTWILKVWLNSMNSKKNKTKQNKTKTTNEQGNNQENV